MSTEPRPAGWLEQEPSLRRYCACGFDPFSVPDLYSAAWYQAHRDHHLSVFPDVGQVTRDNLDMLIASAS